MVSVVWNPTLPHPHHYHKWQHTSVNVDLLVGEFIVNRHGMANKRFRINLQSNTPLKTQGLRESSAFFFLFFSFHCCDPLLSKKDAKHMNTIKESHSDIPSSLGTWYSATVKIFTSVGSRRWNDWHYAMYFVTAGLPFWSSPHFSQVIFPVAAGLNSTFACLNLSYFDSKHWSCDWPAGAIRWLLPEHEADKWFQPRKN